jgi:glycosyltransferase involved in cell wall biosynthesis
MKIAVWHNLPSGGGKRALYYHVRGLVQRGHTVESWCPTTADQRYLPLRGLIKENTVPLHWERVALKSPLKKVWWAIFDMFHNIKAMNEHCLQCAEQINRGGFDILFANSSLVMSVAPIGRYVNVPKVLYLQEPMRTLYEAMPKLPWVAPDSNGGPWNPKTAIAHFQDAFTIKYLRALAREEWHNITAYDAVLVNSLFSRENTLRTYGVNARQCYLGIDTGLFTDRHQKREDFVVGVGAFAPVKNIEFVIKALSCVGSPRPRLVWIGNQSAPDYLDGLRALARSLRVDFEAKEMVRDDELVDILNRAAMMVYAPRLEPFGFAPLEGNACGLPVVAVAEGGVRETITDGVNGLLVDPDETAMARAIEGLRDDKDLSARLGRNGRKIVEEKWSLDASIDRLERRLEEVIGKTKNNIAHAL